MSKKILLILASFLFSATAFAQGSPTGIGYIPGMPVPQASPAPSNSSEGGIVVNKSEGKIAKVRVTGKDDPKPKAAPTPKPETGKAANDGGPERAGYKGVTPPSRLEPENKAVFSRSSANQLSWIGFMPEEGGHRIFLQTSKPTTFEKVAADGKHVEIRIADTKLKVANNQRELDMSYFQTPFAKARAVQKGKDVRVIIQLKDPVDCRVEQHDNMIEVIAVK